MGSSNKEIRNSRLISIHGDKVGVGRVGRAEIGMDTFTSDDDVDLIRKSKSVRASKSTLPKLDRVVSNGKHAGFVERKK